MIPEFKARHFESYTDNKGYGDRIKEAEIGREKYNALMTKYRTFPNSVSSYLKEIDQQLSLILEEMTKKKQGLRLPYADELAELGKYVAELTDRVNETLNEQ